MSEREYYTGIDQMRFAAALLVIAIHTSPLSSISAVGDLILTRSIARIAVPFFLMTTGFFTLSRYHRDNSGLRHFLKKTGMIYAAAMLLYLPLNIYNGYFEKPCLLPNILKDLVFDGTMYHLWYLPASMLGMVIAWRLVEKLDFSKGLAVAALLYLIGLFGDSYYGIAAGVPVIKDFYGLLFQLLDYTRNGVFFAPVFLMFGGYMAEKKPRLTQKQSLGGFALSLAAMTAEALLLHQNRLPRHDSMYLLLPLCMMFLFRTLLFVRGKEARGLRAATLVIYLIHPMIIVAVRAAGKADAPVGAAGREQPYSFCGGVRYVRSVRLCRGDTVAALRCKAKAHYINRACLYRTEPRKPCPQRCRITSGDAAGL